MTTNDIKHIINQGETTTVQFKERVNDAYKLGIEMVAFSNSQGNKLLFENAKSLLPYIGVGSGITRVLRTFDKISFDNNIVTGEFVTTLLRDEVVEDNTENADVNGGVNAGVNAGANAGVKLSDSESKIIDLIEKDNRISYVNIAKEIKVNESTVYRNIKKLIDRGILARIGADKNGYWKIIDREQI
ncbi:MAG: winged helix-turn-helix transcriptional regulator [Tannerella sp.]|jgi:predicted HTH transcriptional regulator|nr:winged helix-turn-helix transcriptional regulator [Tannerella sp.]